jgi:hypothetical protein
MLAAGGGRQRAAALPRTGPSSLVYEMQTFVASSWVSTRVVSE